MRQAILGMGDKKGGGAKLTYFFFVLRENNCIKPITEILGEGQNKEDRGGGAKFTFYFFVFCFSGKYCHQMLYFKAKMHQIQSRLGFAHTPLGELTALHQTL